MAGFFGKMLTHLKNKIQALQKFSFKDELISIVDQNREKIADLQAKQLFTGVDSEGMALTLTRRGGIYDTYAPFTIQEKIKKGQPYDRITWRDTGALYASLKAQIQGSKFRITSNNFKFDKLIRRSGEEAIGLNLDSRRDFVMEITRPQILDVFRKKVVNV